MIESKALLGYRKINQLIFVTRNFRVEILIYYLLNKNSLMLAVKHSYIKNALLVISYSCKPL